MPLVYIIITNDISYSYYVLVKSIIKLNNLV